MAVRHIVMWSLKNADDAAFFQAELESCRTLVPGILHFEVGVRTEGHEANVDVLLNSLFENEAALAAYQNHPHHKAVGARVGPLRRERHVLDYPVARKD